MRPSRRRILLALLILGAVLNYADRQIIALLKPLIGLDFHWTDAQYGNLASAFQFAAAFGLLFAGWFVDRVGVKWANPLAVGAWSAIAMGQALARTVLEFGAMRIALGAAESLGTPVVVKSIAVLFPPSQRSVAFGGMNAASTAGAIVTPLLVPALAAALGWRSAFMIVGGAGLVWVIVWMVAARGAVGLDRMPPDADTPFASISYRSILRDRRTWAVCGAKILSDQTWWFLLFWAPDLLHRQYQLSVGETAAPLAVIYSCAAVGALAGGVIPPRLLRRGLALNRARGITLLACALLAVPVAFVPAARGEWLTVSLLGLTLAAHQGFSVNLFALIADIVPVTQLATVTGIGAFAGNLGGMGILSFTGWVLTRSGNYGPVFGFCAAAYLLALLWLHLLLPSRHGFGIDRTKSIAVSR